MTPSTGAWSLYNRFASKDKGASTKFLRVRSFFVRADFGEAEQTLLPRFSPGPRLFSTGQPEQGCATIAQLDVVTGRKFLRLPEKPFLGRSVEDQFPFEMFLAGNQEWNRLEVGI